jgi:hypothetical protein
VFTMLVILCKHFVPDRIIVQDMRDEEPGAALVCCMCMCMWLCLCMCVLPILWRNSAAQTDCPSKCQCLERNNKRTKCLKYEGRRSGWGHCVSYMMTFMYTHTNMYVYTHDIVSEICSS